MCRHGRIRNPGGSAHASAAAGARSITRTARVGRPTGFERAGLCAWLAGVGLLAVLSTPRPCRAADAGVVQPPAQLKHLSLEELLQVEVTSVTRSPEPLSQAASAVQVVTGEEIHRSAAQTLPEAIRLASNFEIAQQSAHDWAITARGFNGAPLTNNGLADKLLVMIDGRTVYTPLFAGVFWDQQHVLLEDIDRIEAVSGPAGTQWGANAVNGVLNVVTKNARETQGLYVSGAGGTRIQDLGAARYGGRLGERTFYRVYGQRLDERASETITGASADDAWWLEQGGFRMDRELSKGSLTLQGDAFQGRESAIDRTRLSGQNVLARWVHPSGGTGEWSVQAFYDRAWRHLPGPPFTDELLTWDLDAQQRLALGDRHALVWGVGGRVMEDRARTAHQLSFDPERRRMNLGSAFLQDQVTIVPSRVTLTVGTKVEHNAFSGTEWQPDGRLAWSITERHMVWLAASRAVRSPSRFDADVRIPSLFGTHSFRSEKLDAYEVGARVRPSAQVSLSVAAFSNRYRDVRSIDTNTAPPPALLFANHQKARTDGLELAGTVQAAPWWRVIAGANWLQWKFENTSPLVLRLSQPFEAIDPHDHFQLHSMMDLGRGIQLDVVARAVGRLGTTPFSAAVPSYGAGDVRLAWHTGPVELEALGTNLWAARHVEFVRAIPRAVSARLTWRRK